MSTRPLVALASAIALLLAGAAACRGGNDGAPSSTPTPATPIPTVAVELSRLPTPAPVDVNVSLARYSAPDGAFAIGYPEGWVVTATSGRDLMFAPDPSTYVGLPPAHFTLACIDPAGRTVEEVAAFDAALVKAVARGFDAGAGQVMRVGGKEGKRYEYLTPLSADAASQQIALYVQDGPCVWRLIFSYLSSPAFPQDLHPLFERIAGSFELPASG